MIHILGGMVIGGIMAYVVQGNKEDEKVPSKKPKNEPMDKVRKRENKGKPKNKVEKLPNKKEEIENADAKQIEPEKPMAGLDNGAENSDNSKHTANIDGNESIIKENENERDEKDREEELQCDKSGDDSSEEPNETGSGKEKEEAD